MAWWHNSQIPFKRPEFIKIISGFVFDCPSSIKNGKVVGKNPDGSPAYKATYKPISARGVSFKERDITGNHLTTILAQIRKPLMKKNAFFMLSTKESVIDKVKNIIGTSNLDDQYFELIVFRERYDMPETESIFYYIRNAFAHGSFECITDSGSLVYLLESRKDGVIKAQMRIRESTLLKYIEFSKMTVSEIIKLQKSKKK